MNNKTVTVNRKKYAVGLFWQPSGTAFSGRNYAKDLSVEIDKRLNLYTEYRTMIGLGARRFGHRVGMSVAATDVMENFSEYTSFLAVFAVGKGFYLVAARNGVIIKDELFMSEQAARIEYVKLSEIPDWGAFVAPGAWGMPRAIEREIEDVLTGVSRNTLHLISHVSATVLSMLMILLFLFGLGLVFSDSLIQILSPRPKVAEIDPELVAEYKRQIEEKNKELDAKYEIEKQAPLQPLVLPYDVLPDVNSRAYQCYQAIAFLMQPITGWNQILVDCNEDFASVEFKRSFGTLADFYNQATVLMPGAFVQEITDDILRVRVSLSDLQTVASVDERDVDAVVRDVQTRFQSIDGNVDINTVVDTLTNGVDTVSLNIIEVAAQSKLVPMQFMKIFDDIGGVYLIKCTWDVLSRTWNYEVIIYAK
ncbi:MAG: type 4b pilus protein PilO2 [Alphaproteobacteria bacterium]|nr:type 4b pilus protein PilO2 [Alphaproteobacteria bacterium]